MQRHGNQPIKNSQSDQLFMPRPLPGYKTYKTTETLVANFQSNIFGMLSVPNVGDANQKLPAFLNFGGSEGGIHIPMTKYLASHGVATLTVGYLKPNLVGKENGLTPPGLGDGFLAKWNSLRQYAQNIDLACFKEPLEFLRGQQQVDPNNITLVGTSYGGMLTLALGSYFGKDSPFSKIAAWTPNAFIPHGIGANGSMLKDTPMLKNCACSSSQLSANAKQHYSAQIQLNRISVPVFLASGGLDRAWFPDGEKNPFPDNMNSEWIYRQITEGARGKLASDKPLHYPMTGHCFYPHELVEEETQSHNRDPDDWYVTVTSGGTAAAIKEASTTAWQAFWEFALEQQQ